MNPLPLPQSWDAQPKASWRRRVLFALLISCVGWIYWWTAQPLQHGGVVNQESREYYNLLGRGFLRGHLYLDTPVDPSLALMKNPLDPVERAGRGLHDASYFQNKYYLYFGITPELLLFLPFHFLTGTFVSESFASVIFSSFGFLFSIGLVGEIQRRYFPKTTLWVLCGILLALGWATMVPSLLRRASVWEVPITCAYACAMAALWCLAKAFLSRRRGFWLGWASLAMGLAVGARPVYLFASGAVVLPLLYWVSDYGGWASAWRKRGWWKLILAALGPVALCGLGLAAYNFLRFGSISEFGQRYQMAGDEVSKLKLFSWSYPWYGFRIYMLAPASTTPYFPFVSVILAPKPPAGNIGMEDPYGVFPNIPFVFLALGLLILLRRGSGPMNGTGLSRISVSVLLVGLLTAAVVMSFGGITNRYEVDFVPAMIIEASFGTLLICHQVWFRGLTRFFGSLVIAGLMLFSIAFNLLTSIQHNNLLRDEQPKLYEKVAHAGNYFSYGWDRLTGATYGPIEMKVVFPENRADHYEALVVTGVSFRSDYLWIHYIGKDAVEFGFEHTSRGGTKGTPIHYHPGNIQTLRIDMGSLYPPPSHPFFDQFSSSQAHAIQRSLQVVLNGEVSLQGVNEFYDATARIPSIGTSANRPAFNENFSGKIISWQRLPREDFPTPPPVESGPVRMVVKFPLFSGARSEPLISSGRSGIGDLFFIRYLNDHQVLFGHDNWGGQAVESEACNVDFGVTHTIEIDYGSLYPPKDSTGSSKSETSRTLVRLDGKTVLDRPAPFHTSASEDVVVGKNAIQASSAFPVFSGSLIKYERLSKSLLSSH